MDSQMRCIAQAYVHVRRKQTSKCPICRDTVDSMLEIKRPKTVSAKQNVDTSAAVTAAVNEMKLKD